MTSRELTISYREACRNYGYGFTLGAFMTTTFLAIVLEWTTVAQETAQVLFLGIAFIGCTTGLAARYRPVWFYQHARIPGAVAHANFVKEGRAVSR